MRQVLPNIYLIEGLRVAHVCVLISEEGLTLIDSGTPGEADKIAVQVEEGGYALSDMRAIVVTHAHSDHTGCVAELARRSGAQVLAHRDEVPLTTEGESSICVIPSFSRQRGASSTGILSLPSTHPLCPQPLPPEPLSRGICQCQAGKERPLLPGR